MQPRPRYGWPRSRPGTITMNVKLDTSRLVKAVTDLKTYLEMNDEAMRGWHRGNIVRTQTIEGE